MPQSTGTGAIWPNPNPDAPKPGTPGYVPMAGAPQAPPPAPPPSTDPTYGQNSTTPGWDQSHYSTYQGGQQQDISINQMPGYADYQNFGTAAELYGQNAASALNGSDVTGSMADLAAQANGTAPSAAQAQQTAGIQQGLSQAQAQAASTRGNFGLANAQKTAQSQQATAASANAQQNSVLRAQEMATGAQNYGAAALGNQAQNTGVYEANAGNSIQQSGLAAGLSQAQATTNLGQNTTENQRAMASAAASGATWDALIAGAATTGAAAISSGGGGGGGGGSAMSAMSDERAKKDIQSADKRPAEGSPIMAQLDHFTPEVFRYKDPRNAPNPEAGNAPHLGVMAQDVERGPAGATLVKHDAVGMKHLDVPAMVGTLAAGAGALKQRTDDHEDRLRRLESALGGRRAA